jgi:hypothetical protein
MMEKWNDGEKENLLFLSFFQYSSIPALVFQSSNIPYNRAS